MTPMKEYDLFLSDGTIISDTIILEHQDIFITHGKIKSISPHRKANKPSSQNSMVVHLDGQYLLPGFIDSHVHLILSGLVDIVSYVKNTSKRTMESNAYQHMMKYRNTGITTIGDMGDYASITSGLKSFFLDDRSMPTIVNTGSMITSSIGHVKTIAARVESSEQLQNIMIEQINNGCDMIKLIISGGLLTPGSSPLHTEMNPSLIKHAADMSRVHKKAVAAHTYSDHDINNAIKAGIDRIEHGIFATAETIRKASKNNIIFTPTLKAVHDLLDHQDVLPDQIIMNAQTVKDQIPEFIKQAKEHKLKIAMGTDAGTPFNYHGDNLKELLFLSSYGCSSWDCINAATSIAAEKLHQHRQIGSIHESMVADLLVLQKNPIDDISHVMEKPSIIIKNGIILD